MQMEQPMDAQTIAEARERLRAKMGAQQRGKKGSVRMAPRVAERKPENEKIKQALKKFNLQNIGPIEEVILHKSDNTAMHFSNPRVNIDLRQNVTAITGNFEVKESQNMTELLRKFKDQMALQQQMQSADEAIPDLVEDFEAVAQDTTTTDERKLEEVD